MQSAANPPGSLITTSDLAGHTSDPRWLVVDCRSDLLKPATALEAYKAGHIPGAIYASLDRDLAAHVTPSTGRHPLPAPEVFAATLGSWGVDENTMVVAYDADTGAYAARLWWMLRWVGHERTAVLDGGYKAWTAAGLPTSTEIPHRAPTRFIPRVDRSKIVDAGEVADRVARDDWRVLDARAPERFAGAVEPIDAVAGHVPGARNHPFSTDLGSDGRFLGASELRTRFENSQAGVADDHTIVMCGSGVTACHLLLALEVAGKPGARLYAGSWSEWIRDPSRPVIKGS
jgi:thiosulfate/3-mercaptopyruvate sulfurtransferase